MINIFIKKWRQKGCPQKCANNSSLHLHYIKWRQIVNVINFVFFCICMNFCRFPSIVDVVPGLLGASIR